MRCVWPEESKDEFMNHVDVVQEFVKCSMLVHKHIREVRKVFDSG